MSTQPLSNSQRTQTISEIDRRIDHCLQELQSLRSQRNCLASHTQHLLPPHILLSIFLIYQKREVLEFKVRSRHSSWPQELGRRNYCPLPYLVPSHVCSHWRQTVLSHPPFWSILFLNNTKWTKELLVRSKTSPLRLHIQLPENIAYSSLTKTEGGQLVACLKMALTESHRFESLDLDGGQASSFNLLSNEKGLDNALKKALPPLHRLRLKMGNVYSPFNSWNKYKSFRFTDQLKKKLPPMLCSLEICAMSPALLGSGLGSGFASNFLTRLECVDVPQHSRPSVAYYLKLLGRLPVLEVLILDGALPSNPDVEPPETVTHASLKCLSLRGEKMSLRVYAQVLEHLTLPPMTLLYLNAGRNPARLSADPWHTLLVTDPRTVAELREELSSLFLALRPYFSSSSRRQGSAASMPFRSMAIGFIHDGFCLSFARENKIGIDKVYRVDDSHHFWEFTNIDIKLELTELAYSRFNSTDSMNVDSDPSRVIVELLHDIVQTAEHAVLVEYARRTGTPHSLVPWIAAFSESGSLKELDIKLSTSFEALLSSMTPVTAPQLNGENASLTFPALEKIMVREVNFSMPPPLSPGLFLKDPLPKSLQDDIPSPLSQPSVLESNDIEEADLPANIDPFPSPPSSRMSLPSDDTPAWPRIDLGSPPCTFFLPSTEGKDFPSVFRVRKAAGHSLRTLSFHNCASFDPSISLHFADTVDDIKWDGLDSKFWDLWLPPQVRSIQGPPAGEEDKWSSNDSEEEPQLTS